MGFLDTRNPAGARSGEADTIATGIEANRRSLRKYSIAEVTGLVLRKA
jgi:hypothetical protein